MARTLGPTIEQILRRVRQEGGLAIDLDAAVKWFSRCNRTANMVLKRVLTSESFTTVKQKLVYNIRADIANCLDMLTVVEGTRELLRCKTIDDLSAYDIDWFRKIDGTQFEAWVQVARDLFILYPAKAAGSSVTVTYVKLLTAYTELQNEYTEELELPDEDVEFAMLLTELVLLSRNRKFAAAATRIQRITDYLKGFGIRV